MPHFGVIGHSAVRLIPSQPFSITVELMLYPNPVKSAVQRQTPFPGTRLRTKMNI